MIDRFSPFLVSYSLNLLLNYQIKPALLNLSCAITAFILLISVAVQLKNPFKPTCLIGKNKPSKAHITLAREPFLTYVSGRNFSSAHCLLFALSPSLYSFRNIVCFESSLYFLQGFLLFVLSSGLYSYKEDDRIIPSTTFNLLINSTVFFKHH